MATQFVSILSKKKFVSLGGLHHHRSSSNKTLTGKRRARHGEQPAGFSPASYLACVCEAQEKGYDYYKVGIQASNNNTTKERKQPPDATGDNKNRLKGKKRNKEIANRELPRFIGLWFMSSAISYILRKARAFYNEFCCDTYDDPRYIQRENEQMLVHPYFSVPVLPHHAAATSM